ncbi:MAG: PAS domain S-box protein [Spirulinaceae cyanobacterium]
MNFHPLSLPFTPNNSMISWDFDSLPSKVAPDLPISSAIALMSQNRQTCNLTQGTEIKIVGVSSCLLVMQDEALIGILTERDIVRHVAAQASLENCTVADVMTAKPVTLARSQLTDIFSVLNIFRQHHFRHLPIIDDDGEVLGVITPETLRQLLQPADLLRVREIEEVMQRQVVTASPQTSLLIITRLLYEKPVSCVVIVAGNSAESPQPVGILTERDIVQFQALGLDFSHVRAEQVMSTPLFSLQPHCTLWEAHQAMQERRIRRLVVTNEQNHLLGLVTQSSILQALDPMEMYKAIAVLQNQVQTLEAEKINLLQSQNTQLEAQVKERTLQLTQQAKSDRLLTQIAQRIQISLDAVKVLNPTVTEIQQYFQVDRVVVYQFQPDWQGIVIAEARSPEVSSLLGCVIHDPCFAPAWIEPYRNRRISTIVDVETAPLTECHRQLLQNHQIRAHIVVPILQGNQLWGLLCVQECHNPRLWESYEWELLEQVSTQIGIAIDKSQLYRKVNKELRDRIAAETALKQLNEELEARVATRTAELATANASLKAEIAERQRAETQVRQSEQHLRDILNRLLTFVGVLTPDGLLTEMNNPPLNLLDVAPEAMLDKPFIHAPWWLDEPLWQDRLQVAIARGQRGESSRYDVPIQTPRGEVMVLDFSIQPIFDESGQVSHLVASGNDITERQQAQATLQKHLSAIEAAIDGIAILENDRYVYLNDSHVTLFGYDSAEELMGQPWQILYSEAELARFSTEVFPILAAQGHWQGEAIATRRDGSTLIEELSLTFSREGALICVCRDMTAQKQLEVERQQLLKEVSDFKYALDQAAIVAITDPQGRITYANDNFCQISQYSRKELLGQTHQIVNSGFHDAEFFQQMWRTLAQGQVWRGEVKNKAKDGSFYWVDTTIVPFLNAEGKPYQYLAIRNDISDRKLAEIALQESETKFRQMAENIDQVFWMTDTQTQQRFYISPAYETIWGRTCESLYEQPQDFITAIEPEDRDLFLAALTQKEQGFDVEYRIRRPDGTLRWIRDRAFPLKDEQGNVYRITGIAEDISDRKLAEIALQESETKFRQMAENIEQVFWMTDTQTQQMFYISPAYEKIWGRTCESLYEQPQDFIAAIEPEDRDRVLAVMAQKEQGFDIEYRIRRPDGTLRWICDRAFPLKDAQGKVYRVTGIAEDVSDRKLAEIALQESKEFLRNVIDTDPNLIFVKDAQGRFILANQAVADLLNTTVEAVIGKTAAKINLSPEDAAQHSQNDAQALQQGLTVVEETVTTPEGETRYFQSIKTPLLTRDGSYQLLGVATDITARKRAEQEMHKALQRERELSNLKSRFVSMTSHEFRTPLAVISSSAAILQTFAAKLKEEQKQQHLDTIQTYIKHTTQLLDDILLINKAEAGKLAYKPEPLEIAAFCDKLISELQMSAPQHRLIHHIEAQTDLILRCDQKLVRQILMNLLSNAIKYSPENSEIVFRLHQTETSVIFKIKDCGIGIPPEDIKHLFESFHRATNVGNRPGTGLGLSIVKKCVELHGGEITVASQMGEGTTFSVTLPLQRN